jgi:uncharacterized protein
LLPNQGAFNSCLLRGHCVLGRSTSRTFDRARSGDYFERYQEQAIRGVNIPANQLPVTGAGRRNRGLPRSSRRLCSELMIVEPRRCALALLAFVFGAVASADELGVCLVNAAREQIGVTLTYDPAYRRIDYPSGDIPLERGVCTDVLIRAYRILEMDLQSLVHEDMKAAWEQYPKFWGLSRPDTNIDHRRVPNLATFLKRHADTLPISTRPDAYAPGDIVTWRLSAGVPHIGVVSDRRAPSGAPLIIHNIGSGTVEEDILFRFAITGHYRHLPSNLQAVCAARRSEARSGVEGRPSR